MLNRVNRDLLSPHIDSILKALGNQSGKNIKRCEKTENRPTVVFNTLLPCKVVYAHQICAQTPKP
jgi:hypothetical protein